MIPFHDAGSPSARTAPSAQDDLERLGEEIADLAADLHAATYRLLVRLNEFDQRQGWHTGFPINGFLSCAHWLSWRTGIDLGAAREKVRVARALGTLPGIRRAMELGELSYSKVRALTRIATPETEEELIELARHATASQVETFVRAWRRADRVADAQRELRRHEGRYLSVHVDEDGSYVVRGRLDPEVGALFERALESAAMTLVQSEREVTEFGGTGTTPPAPTAAQRRADALGLLVEAALNSSAEPSLNTASSPAGDAPLTSTGEAHPNSTSSTRSRPSSSSLRRLSRAQVVVHVDVEALRSGSERGQSVLAGGLHVSAETSRRLACDASRVVMAHDSSGRVLDVGRSTRTIPTAIRRALEARDRGCRFPGCSNRITDAHHMRHWADGGATTLDNLLLLCRRHHRIVHEGGYGVIRTGSEGFAFTDPHGRIVPDVPAIPPVRLRPPEGAPPTESRQFGSANRCEPGVRRGSGEPLDLDWAMRTLYRPPLPRRPGVRCAAPAR